MNEVNHQWMIEEKTQSTEGTIPESMNGMGQEASIDIGPGGSGRGRLESRHEGAIDQLQDQYC